MTYEVKPNDRAALSARATRGKSNITPSRRGRTVYAGSNNRSPIRRESSRGANKYCETRCRGGEMMKRGRDIERWGDNIAEQLTFHWFYARPVDGIFPYTAVIAESAFFHPSDITRVRYFSPRLRNARATAGLRFGVTRMTEHRRQGLYYSKGDY